MTKIKDNNKEKRKMPWWEAVLIGMMIVFIFNGFSGDNEFCVKSCQNGVASCLSTYTSYYADGCVEYDDKTRCLNRLDSCLDGCFD